MVQVVLDPNKVAYIDYIRNTFTTFCQKNRQIEGISTLLS